MYFPTVNETGQYLMYELAVLYPHKGAEPPRLDGSSFAGALQNPQPRQSSADPARGSIWGWPSTAGDVCGYTWRYESARSFNRHHAQLLALCVVHCFAACSSATYCESLLISRLFMSAVSCWVFEPFQQRFQLLATTPLLTSSTRPGGGFCI